MQKLTYRITTESPILFAQNVGDANMVSTREYIPGSVIMGLFANEYIRKNNLTNAHTDGDFYRWFLTGAIRFTNACIVTEIHRSEKMTTPLPLSIQEEKGDENTMYDLLYANDDFDKQTNAKQGFGRILGADIYKQPIQKTLNFHHQRDYETGTVKKGMIFNYESIDAHQTFEGHILGNGNELNKLLDYFKEEPVVRIGRSKNAQYGKVRFVMVSRSPEEFTSEIEGLEQSSEAVSLTLLSNTIQYNEYGYSTAGVRELEELLQQDLGNGVTINRAFVRTDEVENFVSVWRLRRPAEVCFSAGSCFLLNGITNEHHQKLLEIQEKGIGERRGEGFGRVAFGWQSDVYERFTKRQPDTTSIQQPTTPIPEETKKIVRLITRDHIRKEVEIKALTEANEFIRLPSKSCIGRLESMVKDQDRTKFLESLAELKKPAKDALERCVNKEQTLWDFLEKKEVTVKEVFGQSGLPQEIRGLCGKTGFSPEADNGLNAELYRTYFLTFFSSMRKKIKQGENIDG